MVISHYAPVVIPTLNRYEHFKRCLESLERCTGAEYTDVYVGLDYPPSDKYVEGWKKIDEYLKWKETHSGFKKLYVRRRNHNCGVGVPGSNAGLLCREMETITDRYIFTEDDNEFSPCFLDFMNKALEKFKDDGRVIFVCGYTPFDYAEKESIYFAHQMFAWGYGSWTVKSAELRDIINLDSLAKTLTDFKASMTIYRYRPVLLSRLMDEVIKRVFYGDVSYTCYCELYAKYCVFPSTFLVRNVGFDGSGVHSKQSDISLDERILKQDVAFELDEVVVSEHKEVRRMLKKVGSKHWYGSVAILLRYLVWRISRVDIFAFRKKFR